MPSSSASSISVDEAFELLQTGKSHEDKGDQWRAAVAYARARDLLNALGAEGEAKDGEEAKIHKLYREKATEYLHHARKCLIDGMAEEKAADEAAGSEAFASISDENAKSRTDAFCSLFSKPIEATGAEAPSMTTNDIETRLLELNKSLPSGFKTSDERMKDISRGLNRLGLSSLYTQSEKPKLVEEDLVPKSEDDQVAEIMAQARDEVAASAQDGHATLTPTEAWRNERDYEDDLSSTDSEDSEVIDRKTLQSDNCDDVIAVLTIRKKIAKAQVRLAETMALLEEAKTALDREEEEADIGLDTESLSQKGSVVVLGQGKKKLRQAKRDLRKALDEWKESDLP